MTGGDTTFGTRAEGFMTRKERLRREKQAETDKVKKNETAVQTLTERVGLLWNVIAR